MKRYHLAFISTLLLCFAPGCSDSEDKEEDGFTWDCYTSESFGDCDCYGLEPGMLNAVGGDAKPVDVCPMYPKCVTYLDSFGDKMCSCGDESYQPFANSTDIKPADACPPE